MICVLSLIVFSILGIFSLSYRKLAKEAFACVFRRITLRPCNTGFNQKIKAWIIGPLLRRNTSVAGFVNRHFEIISWIFVILFFASLFWSAQAGYNLIKYKTCNPEDPQSCVLTAEPATP